MDIYYKPIQAKQTHLLRQKILRPNQPIEEMVYPLDSVAGSFHLGAFLKDQLVGIVSVYPESQKGELNQGLWRIRGMAVDSGYQGHGIGRSLIKECKEILKGKGAKTVWCNARTTAIQFYITLGFEKVGEEFEIEGIGPHYIAQLKL